MMRDFLSYEMGRLPCFFFRQAVFFFAKCNCFYEKTHISGEHPHGLQTFCILFSLTLFSAVNTVPVLTGCNRHSADGEKFIQFVKCRRTSATSCNNDTCTAFHCLVKMRAVEETVKTGYQSSICRSVINWRCHNQSVSFFKFWCKLIHDVITAIPF